MKQELSSRMRVVALLSLAAFTLPFTSCGDDASAESVFVYVINGYTGSNGLTIIGPTGTVASTLAFGERVGPVEINRALGTEFTLLLDGTPQAIDLTLELFSLYPQETGTLILKRRSGDQEAAISLYRHVQSISPGCQLTFENALSLDEQYLSFGNQFTFAPEFRIENINLAGYLDEATERVQTECGPLPNVDNTPGMVNGGGNLENGVVRDQSQIAADPYFFLTPCKDPLRENQLCYQWGVFGEDLSTNIIGRPPTAEYFACLSQAVEIKQPESDPPLPFPPEDAQAQCPPDDITWNDVTLTEDAIAQCAGLKAYESQNMPPGTEGNRTESIFFQEGDCNHQFRIVTPGLQTIFGPGNDPLGSHQNGDFVESTISIPRGSEHFFILFGRPVNPLIWQWDSGGSFVDLARYPYFNDQNGRIGDTDFPR